MLINLCRICGRSNKCDKSINIFDSSNRKLVRHIQMLTGLRLRNTQVAPVSMCFCCQSDIKSAMSFRRLCIKTQKKWQKLDKINENSSLSETDSLNQVSIPRLPPHCQELNSEIEADEAPLKTIQTTTLKEIKDLRSSDCANIVDEQDNLNLNSNTKVERDANTPHKSHRSKTEKASIQLLKSKQEITNFICELCGIHVNSKASLDRHIRKHTGERPFPCEECTARFLSAAELRAHRLTHTGERPFACRYCDRRYVSYMGRLKHERIHTNERPFVCAECGKTFTNAYILKNHMLVHTGERLFRCEQCQRLFQRKTHLRTHYRSKAHKQKVMKKQNEQNTVLENV